MSELLIATNPDPDSRLPYLIRVPYGGGLVFRAGDTWPRTKAVYCYPIDEWPDDAEIVERVRVRSCVRRGAAIDLVLDRARENRSQIVYTTARGRDAVFWQSARTRKVARPGVRTPAARAAAIADIPILIDSHERYAFKFAGKQAVTERRKLPAGDYGIEHNGRLVAAVERKSLADLVSSLTGGKLRYQLSDLASLPHAAVVVEDRYSQVYKLEWVRPAIVANGLAELQVHLRPSPSSSANPAAGRRVDVPLSRRRAGCGSRSSGHRGADRADAGPGLKRRDQGVGATARAGRLGPRADRRLCVGGHRAANPDRFVSRPG